MEILIRAITRDDATAVNNLSAQLGYALTPEQTIRNVELICSNENLAAFAAISGDAIVGWIGLAMNFQLESVAFAEIRGLIVDEEYRGKGIGKLLVGRAQQWALEKKSHRLRLGCNVKRHEAHLFYELLGFAEVKQQKVFEIQIGS